MNQTQHSPQESLVPAPNTDDLLALRQEALLTLKSLQTPLGIMASGPKDHYHAIFGRDSLWSILLALEAGHVQRASQRTQQSKSASIEEYDTWLHESAATVLRGLASLQGQKVNDSNEEQPGRIVHEYWDPVPQHMLALHWPLIEGRYYGAFDSTFLYVITVAQIDAYFHDAALLEELWPHVERALHWMLEWSDLDHDGLVEYQRRNPEGYGLVNQVWKDSTESIQPQGPTRLKSPLAWIELQGYAWAAYTGYLQLAERRRSLDPLLQREIQQRIEGLQKGIQRFWLADEQFPAIALDGDKEPLPAVSSNAGHLLWSGMLSAEQASPLGRRLMQPDLCTPWGIRTLSDQAYYYNPLLYHCGTIWPFDNAIAAVGLQRYGFTSEARSVAQRVLQAIQASDNPVELYVVFPASRIRLPKIEQQWVLADYLESCNIQAWTAAAMIYLTSLLLG